MSYVQLFGHDRVKYKRDIQKVLDEKGVNLSDVGARIGVSKQSVSACLRGINHSPKVLDALRKLGVPEKFLCDPRRQREQRSA